MNVKRFFGVSSREAIKQVRAELGIEAIILSNREVEGGVEVIASVHGDIAALIARTPKLAERPFDASATAQPLPTMARIAHAAQTRLARPAAPGPQRQAKSAVRLLAGDAAPAAESFAHYVRRSEDSRTAHAAPEVAAKPAPVAPEAAARNASESRLIAEIQQMKSILQQQMGVMSWRETAARRPLQAKLIAQLLSAGFSPVLCRAIADKLPADFNEQQAALWVRNSLARNLLRAPAESDMVDRGGVYALVGPTGVGKTTSAAKLAARCVLKYRAKSLGLITVDSYRIGAEDQLRAYGKILGVTVHAAHDAQSLADLIALMRDRHLVLIDTIGMGQRDSRVLEQMQMLNAPGIEPVLFLNASAQAETLEDVVRLYSGPGLRRPTKVILSKIDEAVKYGFALDCVIRHKLELQYVTNGQRVPEDLHPADTKYLVHRALKHGAARAFAIDDADIPLVLFGAAAVGKPVAPAALHA